MANEVSQREQEFDQWVTWPEWAKDALTTETVVRVSLADALWILVRRRFSVDAKTFVPLEIPAPRVTLSRFYVDRRWPWQRRFGMVTSAAPPPPAGAPSEETR